MKRYEVLQALDNIREYSDTEITANAEFIRNVAIAAYGLIKQQQNKKPGSGKVG